MTCFDHLRLLFDVYQNDLPDLINYLCTALKMEKGFFSKKKRCLDLLIISTIPLKVYGFYLKKKKKRKITNDSIVVEHLNDLDNPRTSFAKMAESVFIQVTN